MQGLAILQEFPTTEGCALGLRARVTVRMATTGAQRSGVSGGSGSDDNFINTTNKAAAGVLRLRLGALAAQ